jgi:hypothetical protein
MGDSPSATVVELVERCGPSERPQGHIARDRKVFLSPGYKEEQLRLEFLNPFFSALGWDMDNKHGLSEARGKLLP